MKPWLKWALRIVAALIALVAVVAALIAWLNFRGEDPLTGPEPDLSSPALIERGAYLARAGNCAGCHTERGGIAYAGGRGVPTPFGTVYAPNLTPDPDHGLGRWSAAEFWRALHNGRARDGRPDIGAYEVASAVVDPGAGGASTKVSLTDDTGILAAHVAAVRRRGGFGSERVDQRADRQRSARGCDDDAGKCGEDRVAGGGHDEGAA